MTHRTATATMPALASSMTSVSVNQLSTWARSVRYFQSR